MSAGGERLPLYSTGYDAVAQRIVEGSDGAARSKVSDSRYAASNDTRCRMVPVANEEGRG